MTNKEIVDSIKLYEQKIADLHNQDGIETILLYNQEIRKLKNLLLENLVESDDKELQDLTSMINQYRNALNNENLDSNKRTLYTNEIQRLEAILENAITENRHASR